MKKFWISLVLTLMLVFWGGAGYFDFGTSPAGAQPYSFCTPDYPDCYNNYYSAPYADPYAQFFYYAVPPIQERRGEREWREPRERREYEGRGRGPERQERGGERR